MNALPNLRGLRQLAAAALVVLSLVVVHACSSPGEQGAMGPTGPAGAIDQAQLDSVMAAIDAAVPTGVVLPFAGDTSKVPSGFLRCDGAEVSRTTYARLFNVVGIAHGGGDGRDPDAASRAVPQPAASSVGNGGDQVGSVQGQATGRPATPRRAR